MLTSEQMDALIAEWKVDEVREKSKVLKEFLREYGEHASWEEWVAYLTDRPGLRGFDWVRSLFEFSS